MRSTHIYKRQSIEPKSSVFTRINFISTCTIYINTICHTYVWVCVCMRRYNEHITYWKKYEEMRKSKYAIENKIITLKTFPILCICMGWLVGWLLLFQKAKKKKKKKIILPYHAAFLFLCIHFTQTYALLWSLMCATLEGSYEFIGEWNFYSNGFASVRLLILVHDFSRLKWNVYNTDVYVYFGYSIQSNATANRRQHDESGWRVFQKQQQQTYTTQIIIIII